MKVLRAIGRFFARIGRWIRDTAWIQPLLIVAVIFVIVFSIPYITVWVQSWYSGDEDVAYYQKFELSLDGAEDGKSEVDDLFNYLYGKENGNVTEAQQNKYGDKFFVTFVQEDCSGCESAYYGFNYLQNNWNKAGYEIKDGGSFKLFTIFVDTMDDDDKYNLFQKYVYNSYDELFETTAGTYTESWYYLIYEDSLADELANLESEDTFSSPTTFLIDFTSDAPFYSNEFGVSEVLFNYEGTANGGASDSTPQAKATTLRDAWNHEGDFSQEGYRNK